MAAPPPEPLQPPAEVRVLLFGALRDRLGCSEVTLDQPCRTVAELWRALAATRPDLSISRESVLCAVNLEYTSWDALVRAGDEVAFMPPVSGGLEDEAVGVTVLLTEQPIALARLLDESAGPGDGAVVCFVGRVRNHSEGEAVHRLDYEAYAPMALAEMRRIGIAARDRHGLTHVRVVHRTGELAVGEAAVAVVTASAHRAPALEGCREVIDAVKALVPVWKREHTATGARWVDGRC